MFCDGFYVRCVNVLSRKSLVCKQWDLACEVGGVVCYNAAQQTVGRARDFRQSDCQR